MVVVHHYSARVPRTLQRCGMETISRQKSLAQQPSDLRSVTRTSQENFTSRNNNDMPLYFVVEHVTLVGPFVCWITKKSCTDGQMDFADPKPCSFTYGLESLHSITLLSYSHFALPSPHSNRMNTPKEVVDDKDDNLPAVCCYCRHCRLSSSAGRYQSSLRAVP